MYNIAQRVDGQDLRCMHNGCVLHGMCSHDRGRLSETQTRFGRTLARRSPNYIPSM